MTSILLMTSNGTGMGHLTRQAAVALMAAPEDKVTLFSLSIGLPLATGLGIQGEYCPSYDRPWIDSRDWHSYLRDRLIAIVEEVDADAVVFDGVAPYPGIGLAARDLLDVAFVWMRRGMWRKGTGKAQLKKRRFFDLVIEPGDVASAADVGPTSGLGDAIPVGPITILEPLPALSRIEAREALGLPADGPIALVTLGSGRLGEVAGPGGVALDSILENSGDWHVAVTRSPVAVNEITVEQASRVTLLRGVYPLARYLPAFDVAVSSAGYNAVHELIPAGVPSVFVANTSTRTDDQLIRSRELARVGLGVSAIDHDLESVATSVAELLTEEKRDTVAEAIERLPDPTGATDTLRLVSEFADGFTTRRPSLTETLGAMGTSIKETVKSALGDQRTDQLKRMLGRQPTPRHEKAAVVITDRVVDPEVGTPLPVAIVDSLEIGDLRAEMPVEHVLPGSSQIYRERRRAIVSEYYEVVD